MGLIVLADCNNFFVSCERVFRPKLEKTAVIVLSNNDGCVVSRSNEAKALGIKMGEPFFQIKEFCERHKVAVFSSNFSLYRDFSKRVMNILSMHAEEMQIYSIDEAFLEYPEGLEKDFVVAEATSLREKVKQWTGIPISLGIAETKTLAKIAAGLAKKVGVFDLSSPDLQIEILGNTPIGDVWGIGPRLSKTLISMGIRTALQFRKMDPSRVRAKMGVVGERIFWELSGLRCNELEEEKPKKSITVSRSFGEIIQEKEKLEEVLSTFISKASEKLRGEKNLASEITVFIQEGFDVTSLSEKIETPTSDTSDLLKIGKKIMSKIFLPQRRYKKCGVVFSNLILENQEVKDLFLQKKDPKRKLLMQTVDQLNGRFGKNSLFFGATGVSEKWKGLLHSEMDWDQLPVVRIL
jgi:DNA polymerase V